MILYNYFKCWLKKRAPAIIVALCDHNYKLIDDWSSDALGVPYGYKTYKCTKCGHIDKRFWYI